MAILLKSGITLKGKGKAGRGVFWGRGGRMEEAATICLKEENVYEEGDLNFYKGTCWGFFKD